VKIVYTNLSEDDYGVKRSVTQLHLDFNKTSEQKGASKEGRRRTLSLVASTTDRGRIYESERDSNRAGLRQNDGLPYRRAEFGKALTPRSVVGFYIDKFIKSQSSGTQSEQKGTLINITV
jgi:hypothetical protein